MTRPTEPHRVPATPPAVRRWSTAATAGGSALVVILLLAAPVWGAPTVYPIQTGHLSHYAGPTAPYGAGHVTKCAGQKSYGGVRGSPGALSGWVCDVVKVHGSSGYARGVDQIVTYTSNLSGISGTFTYAGLVNFSLPAGWATSRATCTGAITGGSGTAFSRVYLFYAVWILDTYGSTTTTVTSVINYVWDSGTLSCSAPGSWSVSSPKIVGSFNTSSFVQGPASYTFNTSHTYAFELVLGCTGEAYVGFFLSGTNAQALCDAPDTSTPAFGFHGVELY